MQSGMRLILVNTIDSVTESDCMMSRVCSYIYYQVNKHVWTSRIKTPDITLFQRLWKRKVT